MKGKILLTFDDGMICQKDAASLLREKGLFGVFSITTSKMGTPGFMKESDLDEVQDMGHVVCSHSHTHKHLGPHPNMSNIEACTEEEILEDALKSKEILNEKGFNGNYFIVPFGTENLKGAEQLGVFEKEFDWIRLTIGCPFPNDEWSITGNKRLFPSNYKRKHIGLSVPADMRFPDEVCRWTQDAVDVGSICVVAYHYVSHVVGETQNITWDRFVKDVKFISMLVEQDKLDCILPKDIIGE